MKVGDLVKMKRIMFWQLKENRHQHYTEQPLLVMEQAHNAVKVMYPDGHLKSDLAEHYDVVSDFEEPEGIELTDKELEQVIGGQSAERFEEWRVEMINEYQSCTGLFSSKKSM